jgi:tetratricopeptide (TPR) repeat protein
MRGEPEPGHDAVVDETLRHTRQARSPRIEGESVSEAPAEARLLRQMARAARDGGDAARADELVERARQLLRRAVERRPYDDRALAEQAHLLIDQGQYAEAVGLLEDRLQLLLGAVALRSALGRAQRELARSMEAQYDERRLQELVRPWQQLGSIEYLYRPVAQLADSRACTALSDGVALQERTNASVGALEGLSAGLAASHSPLDKWWAGQVRAIVFPGMDRPESGEQIRPERRLVDVTLATQQLVRESSLLDTLEQELVNSIARQSA